MRHVAAKRIGFPANLSPTTSEAPVRARLSARRSSTARGAPTTRFVIRRLERLANSRGSARWSRPARAGTDRVGWGWKVVGHGAAPIIGDGADHGNRAGSNLRM